jgi:dihydroflavonol-4-reductase
MPLYLYWESCRDDAVISVCRAYGTPIATCCDPALKAQGYDLPSLTGLCLGWSSGLPTYNWQLIMKCFLTGATGFLGSHVARQLLARGAELRLLVRPTSRLENITEIPAERVIGDLRDAASLKNGMSGCEFVFHVAADYRLWSLNRQELYDTNVQGTRNILQAARDSGVRRVVYTSSVATMGFGNNGRLTDETSPVTLDNMIGDYKRSKFMAEQLVLEAGRSGENVVMVNPTTPVGERDIKPTPSGQIIVDFLRRRFPVYVETGLNLVDVVDCAEGHLLAMEKARPGERYILGGENLTLKQILDKLAAITGLPSPRVKLPYAVAFASGVVDTLVTGKMLKREPRANLDAVRMARKKMFVTSTKAEQELGWKPRPVDEALRRAVQWFQANGYVA